ncbi:MAG: hypothetical protein CMP23_09590 [Rickettsiales bacterium]|nr:hypothetical protein [Rickettsiales bacterium]
MASKGALVLPAGVALQIEEGALSIHHQGDIVIEGVPAQPLHSLTSEKGDVKLACPDSLELKRVSAPAGTVSVTGKVSLQSIEAKAVDFSGGNLKISVMNAAKSINLNGAKIEADVILAPKVDIAAGLKGRASAIECSNELGPHKLRGGFNLSEFVSLMPTGAAILRAHSISVPAGEEELGEDDDEPEPAPEPVESVTTKSSDPDSAEAAAAVAAAASEPEAAAATTAVLEAPEISDYPSPEDEFPEPGPTTEETTSTAPTDVIDELPTEAALAIEDLGPAEAEQPPLIDQESEAQLLAQADDKEAVAEANDEEFVAEAPEQEIEEEIVAEAADDELDEVGARLREILEYMGDAYQEGQVPEPIQRIFSYLEGNDLDGLRENLSPLWKDLFKEIQTSGGYHPNAVTRSFRAIRELLGPPSA